MMHRLKPAFTLIEMLVAVLIGAFVMLAVAGTLSSSMNAWASVQERIARNYHRRTALDLVKRQVTSLFYKSDARTAGAGPINSRVPPNARNMGNRNQAGGAGFDGNAPIGFELPANTWFFKGGIQDLSFVSGISFLSDFPGQVAVKYYVVQKEPSEDETEDEALEWERNPPGPEMSGGDEVIGDLYLVVEEQNLLVSSMAERELSGDGLVYIDDEERPSADELSDYSEMEVQNRIALLGPLRTFTIRYRKPAQRTASDAGDEEDWAETWDVDNEGRYPMAIEFTIRYEEPGVTDDLPDEELDGIRMVIPIFDQRNLIRNRNNPNF